MTMICEDFIFVFSKQKMDEGGIYYLKSLSRSSSSAQLDNQLDFYPSAVYFLEYWKFLNI